MRAVAAEECTHARTHGSSGPAPGFLAIKTRTSRNSSCSVVTAWASCGSGRPGESTRAAAAAQAAAATPTCNGPGRAGSVARTCQRGWHADRCCTFGKPAGAARVCPCVSTDGNTNHTHTRMGRGGPFRPLQAGCAQMHAPSEGIGVQAAIRSPGRTPGPRWWWERPEPPLAADPPCANHEQQ